LAKKLGANDYIDGDAQDPAKALRRWAAQRRSSPRSLTAKRRRLSLAALARTGLMVIGAVGPLTVDSFDLLGKRASVKGWYSGIARDSEHIRLFSAQQRCFDE
jgi:alcohol dehydrogenase